MLNHNRANLTALNGGGYGMVFTSRVSAYRLLVVSLLGVVLTGADKVPRQPTQAEQQQAATKTDPPQNKILMVPKAIKPVEPSEYYQPCGEPNSQGKSDLCAQWSAVQAARDAARWAWWQLWLSGLGVIGLGVTLWFNFSALRIAKKDSEETKDALEIAERNAKATSDLVKANRAWVGYDTFVSILAKKDSKVTLPQDEGFVFSIIWKNTSKSPAINVICSTKYALVKKGGQPPEFKADFSGSHRAIIPPGQTYQTMPATFHVEQFGLFSGLKSVPVADFYFYTRIEYSDVFEPEIARFSEACVMVVINGWREEAGGQDKLNVSTSPRGPQNQMK